METKIQSKTFQGHKATISLEPETKELNEDNS